MIRPPFLARVAVGAAVFIAEEARKLPATAISLPMNAVSQMLQTTMHAQQFVTSLAIKGDEALEPLIGSPVEKPDWATFDEDTPDHTEVATNGSAPSTTVTNGTTNGTGNGHHPKHAAAEPDPVVEAPVEAVPAAQEAAEAEIITKIDYPSLTLAQLRARLRFLSIDDLTHLLAYEQQDLARAPFVTMLTNRIATTTAAK